MVKQKWTPWGIISPGSPGMYQTPFFKALGKYANYCITNVPWLDPKQKMAKEFEAAFLKAYPDQICDIDAGFTFEGLLVCADAYKRAGSTKPQALVEALKATNITDRVMLGGPITFDEHGQNVESALGRACRISRASRPWCCRPPMPRRSRSSPCPHGRSAPNARPALAVA